MAELSSGSELTPTSSRRAVRDVLIQVMARAGNLVIGIVVTLVLVRTLGDDDFGRWTTLLAVTQLAAAFTDLGLEPAVVTRAAEKPDEEGDWVGALVTLRVILSIPVFVVSAIVCVLLADSGEMALAGVLLSATLLCTAPNALRVFNQLRVRNDVTMLVLTVNSIGWGVVVVVLALRDSTLVAYAAGFLLISTLTAILQALLSLRQRRQALRMARHLWRGILATAIALGSAAIVMAASSRAPQILVYQLEGSGPAGLYASASRLFEQASFIPLAVMTTMLPIMSVAHRTDPARARRVLQLSMDYLLMATLPGLVLTVVAAEPIMTLLFGEQFAAAAPALPVLMGAFVLIAINYPLDNMILVLGLQRKLLTIALCGLLTTVALTFIFVGRFGFVGAAWAVLVAEAVVTAWTFQLIAAPLGMRLGGDQRLWRVLASSAALLALLVLLDLVGAPLLVLLVATGVAYPALLVKLGAVSVPELRALVRRQPPDPDLAA